MAMEKEILRATGKLKLNFAHSVDRSVDFKQLMLLGGISMN